MEIFLTIFASVSVFTLGQIVLKVYIEPLIKLLDVLGKVSYSILFFQM